MKHYLIHGLLPALTLVLLTGCGGTRTHIETDPPVSDATTSCVAEADQTGNPIEECDTMKEAEQWAGFPFGTPETVEGYEGRTIEAVRNDMIQVFYGDPLGDSVLVRKAKGDADVSGDHNDYEDNQNVTVDGRAVTLRGYSGRYFVAVWTAGGFSYAVDVSNGMEREPLDALIASLH